MRRYFVVRRLLLAIVATALVAGAAGAKGPPEPEPIYDIKTYGGNSCHAYYGNDVGHFMWAAKGIKNVSSTLHWSVMCPIVTDNYRGTDLYQVSVVIQKPAGSSCCCELSSLDPYGTEVAIEVHCFDQDAEFDSATLGIDMPKASGGYYALNCGLPPRGWLLKYQVVERYPTDNDN